ncbi:MAG: SH3 domain-containing protein [Paludibacteraceae bacterium]|nr:SH3 domain-containing protein [Paludibacteraceae bacterium]
MKQLIPISILAAAFCVGCGSSTEKPKENETVTMSSSEDVSSEASEQLAVISQAPQADSPDNDFGVYLDGHAGAIEIMDSPSEKRNVIMTLPAQSVCQLVVNGVSNQWWFVASKISMIEPEEKYLELSEGGWIHSSAIAVSTRNYGGQKLTFRESPEADAKEVYSFTEEMVLEPIDMSGEWVKVKTGDGAHEGWIEAVMLCGNAVSNCN